MRPIVINQHYIPKSYLKNFGFLVNVKKNKWSLYAMENGGEIERRTTENVCAVEYLYDLPFAQGEERQFLEHAYEEHADRHFTEITKFVTDDKKEVLDSAMREKILKSCLSLYFRTPKYVDLDQSALDEIQRLPLEKQEHAWKIKKQSLLEESVQNFERLYEVAKNCGISVCKAVRNWELISGDNPVVIRNRNTKVVEFFGPDNMMHIPLTPKYAVTILPANETSLSGTFGRILWDDNNVMSLNHDIEKHHQRYLIGSKQALESYLKESPAYKAPAAGDDPRIIAVQQLALATQGFVKVSEQFGPDSKELIEYFKYCWKNIEAFRNDPNAQAIKLQLGIEI